jgi:hypothetical protein
MDMGVNHHGKALGNCRAFLIVYQRQIGLEHCCCCGAFISAPFHRCCVRVRERSNPVSRFHVPVDTRSPFVVMQRIQLSS